MISSKFISAMYHLYILLAGLFIVLFINSCDNTGPTTHAEPESLPATDQFFNFAPDSVGPVLTMAIDTLREREKAKPFIKDFIAKHGVPSWEAYSVFPQDGRLVMLVPVTWPDQQKVSGIWNINLEQNRLGFHWIQRDATESPDPEKLKVFMLGFEKRIFGQVQTQGIVITEQKKLKEISKNELGIGNITSGIAQGSVQSIRYCYRRCEDTDSDVRDEDGCDETRLDDVICEDRYPWPRPGGGGGGVSAAEAFENRIDDSALAKGMKDELNLLKSINKGVGKIVQGFAQGFDSDAFNRIRNLTWKVKNGNLPDNVNARTSYFDKSTNTVTTTFDRDKFRKATDLAVARTMLHEAVHAYIVAYSVAAPIKLNETFAELMLDISKSKYNNQNDAQHAEFVRNYVDDIASALQEFGKRRGYNINKQFYTDLAWGGLTKWPKRDSKGNIIRGRAGQPLFEETPWFKKAFPDQSVRRRILTRIIVEQYGGTRGYPQRGRDCGC